MQEFTIDHAALSTLDKQVIVITGGSSGIGLATAELLLALGSYVVIGDLRSPPITHTNLSFVQTDVTSWTSQLNLFKHAFERHSRIDHAFANAGVTSNANYLESRYDADGGLLEPSQKTFEVNLRAMINTCYIAMHYMRMQQDPPGGSVVCTASASSFQRFGVTDYATAKHGVLGFMRGVYPNLVTSNLSIRINAVAPSWTLTGMVPQAMFDHTGVESQGPEVVAKNVALFMADRERNGQLVYSVGGRYYEVEEQILIPAGLEIVGGPEKSDEEVVKKMYRSGAVAESEAAEPRPA